MANFPPPYSIGRVCMLVPPGGSCFLFRLRRRGDSVRVAGLHSFQLSPGAARRLQGELAPRVTAGPPLDLSRVRCVAGADVSTQGDRGYATVAVLSFPELSVVEVRGFEAPLSFPYVPGLLAFREIPPVVGALERIETEVDAVIFDAHGLAHPRALGLASHFGLFLHVPAGGGGQRR